MTKTITGIILKIEPWLLALSSTVAADLDAVARRQLGAQRRRAPCRSASATSGPCTPSVTSARTVISRHPVAAPQDRAPRARSASVRELRRAAPTPPSPVREVDRVQALDAQRAPAPRRARRRRSARSPSRYCVTVTPDSDGLQRVAPACCEVDAERARLVLVDLEPHRSWRLVPVEVDVARAGSALADLAAPARRSPRTCCGSSPEHAELHRVADRRAVLAAAARGRAPPRKSSSNSLRRARRQTRSRASMSLVMTMNWPKLAFGSCWSSGR